MSPHSISKAPLMPKATAVWLIENTALTFQQIADFCGMHILEIQAIANEESSHGMIGVNPVSMGQLTAAEIERCEKDSTAHLMIHEAASETLLNSLQKHKKGVNKEGRYTPRARRGERPDAIAWLLKQYPTITDASIIKLVRTTKPTVLEIRQRTHWNMGNIKPKSPVVLGFCTQEELDRVVEKVS